MLVAVWINGERITMGIVVHNEKTSIETKHVRLGHAVINHTVLEAFPLYNQHLMLTIYGCDCLP